MPPRTQEEVYDIVQKLEPDETRQGLLLNVVGALSQADLNLMGTATEEAILAALRARLPDDGWTGPKPLGYSEYLSKNLGMSLPYEQYGLYGSTAAGVGYCAQQFWRSRLLMRAAHEPNAIVARELMLEANAKEVDVERAVYLAKKFRARGLLVVAGAPIMWLGLMTLSGAYKRKPKP